MARPVRALGERLRSFFCPPGLKPIKFNLQNDVCEGSTKGQNGNDNPHESIFTLLSDYSVADVYIRKYAGSARILKMIVLGGAVLEHGVAEGGIVGHPAVEGVLAVGAVGAVGAFEPGNDAPEPFSDRGPSLIFFPGEETRNKPYVMGIDGVLITGSGGFGRPVVGSSGRLFLGTSAAAPHVAGIAALAIGAQRLADPSMTKKEVADEVAGILKNTAIDLGEQNSEGYSKVFGYGRADALAAIESISASSSSFELDSMAEFTATYTVDSTGDEADDDTLCRRLLDGSGNCTLRAAIQQANAGNGTVIKFNISGTGTRTIQPASALPTITQPVFIDGEGQPGASADTVLIELDGTNAGSGVDGLILTGNGSYVRGLAVNSFGGNGVVLQGRSGGQVLVGNRIGTDTGGATDEGNGAAGVYIYGVPDVVLRDNVISGNDFYGVHISGSGAQRAVIYGNTIGLNAAGTSGLGNTSAGVYIDGASYAALRDNVISGNDSHGVSLSGSGGTNADILANKIGVNSTATSGLANAGSGVHISAGRNVAIYKNFIGSNSSHGVGLTGSSTCDTYIVENYIGANESGAALGKGGSGVHIANSSYNNFVEVNTIANNTGDGVTVTATGTFGNTIWENSIYSNGGLGIDLSDDGVPDNDDGDSDSGPNFLQNFPTDITFATRGDVASVRYSLDVIANRRYIIDYYSSGSCDSAGNGEGKQWLGFVRASRSDPAHSTFTASTLLCQFLGFTAPTVTHITATDTNLNSTSEFAPCVALSVSDDSVATISTTEITFTTMDWSEDVTVTPESDDDALNAIMYILHKVSIGDNALPTALLPVEVIDDDALGLTLTRTGFPSEVSVGLKYDGFLPLAEGDNTTYTGQSRLKFLSIIRIKTVDEGSDSPAFGLSIWLPQLHRSCRSLSPPS